MKTLTVFLLLGLVLSARGYLIKVPTSPGIQPKIIPMGWVQMQKLILPLFENVCEESRNPTIVKFSQDFKLDTTNTDYSSPDVIKNLLDLKANKGFLAKNEIFTEYKIDYLNELKAIYELFYYANDFNAFYKAACWARQNINCGLFIDALYSAILNRKETGKLFLPAPYEILPNYFIRKDFIIKASSLIAGDDLLSDSIRVDGNSYILDVNYTAQVYEDIDESKLVYFYEDVGLNSYYYMKKLKISSWINSDPKYSRYGENLYFFIKQLMARYNLERYSNGLAEIDCIDWKNLNSIPYYNSMLIYSNGNDFSYRTLKHVEYTEKLNLLKNIEDNIATVVTHMREGGFKKSDILNHLIELLLISDKSYENLALEVLNGDTINNRAPSVLEHYMTTLRDPGFWAINKKIVDIVDKALKNLPGYTREELYFPGVEVINVEVKKVMTSFDNFVFDVTDALKTGEDDVKFKVKINQPRLNHKPFSIKVNITSLVSQKGLLRIYLGPKIMPGEHILKKNLFMLLDCFEINLKYGNNIITRTSAEMFHSDDLLSLYSIRKKIEDAEFGLDSSTKLKSTDEQIKFPSRLILPKGLPQGLPLQLFIYVVPFNKAVTEVTKDALLSPGFPLDLNVEVQQLFDLPNALVKDIFIVHKESVDQTKSYGERPAVKTWQNNDYQPSEEPVVLPLGARPDFTMKKEPFDYKSKRGQYGKKEDYAAKRVDYKYNKDYTKVVNRPFVTKKEKYEVTTDFTTNKIPDDLINISKDNFEHVITTDQTYDGGNTFTLDKIIQDKNADEEVHIDVMNNEKIVPGGILENFDDFFHKIVIKNETIHPSDKTVSDKTAEGSHEAIWKNDRVIIDITNDNKHVSDMTVEDSNEKTDYGETEKNKIVDISKTSATNKQFGTISDVIFPPYYDISDFIEEIYE